MFYMSENHDLAVAQIPKAGLNSIRDWLGREFRVVTNDQALSVSRRVAFIRNPVERLASCYSFMFWLNKRGDRHRSDAPVDCWESFVDHILTHDDEHWRPQSEHVGNVPNIIRRFESLPQCFGEFHAGILPHHNSSTRMSVNNYRAGDIAQFYIEDIRLWEAA